MGTNRKTWLLLLALAACTRSATKDVQEPAARVEPADDPIPYQYVVALKPASAPVADVAADLLTTPDAWVLRTYERALRGFAMHATPETALAVAKDPRVLRVSEDGRVKAQSLSVQDEAPAALDRIDQREGTDGSYAYESLAGERVHAYVLDTGVLASHLEFLGRPPDQVDFVRDEKVGDCNGHGTHVAGLIGGATFGVAKAVKIHSLRVLGCDGAGATSDAIAALDWLLTSAQTPAVANLSFGRGPDASLDAAVAAVVAAGIPVVVAAGDANRDACTTSPARVPSALTVAATDAAGAEVPNFSNQGPCVDLFAPGVDVRSASIAQLIPANPEDVPLTYGESVVQSGTSVSAPLVTGAVALYLAKETGATPDEVARALFANSTRAPATKLARYTPDRFLFTPFVDDDNSADYDPPTVSVDAPAPNDTVSGDGVAVTATAGDDVGVTRVELFANGRFIASSVAAPHVFTWDTTREPNGEAALVVRAYDRAGNATDATVTVTVSNDGIAHFDPALGVPRCDTEAPVCDSVDLLAGRAGLGPEANAPNVLAYVCSIGDETTSCVCQDGPFGKYELDESIEAIRVATLGGGPLKVGADVEVEVELYVASPFYDAVDLYSSPTVIEPAWRYLGTLQAEASGRQTLTGRFTLPEGGLQAVRAALRWGGYASTCTDGGFDERDDLAFAVAADGTPDTASPTNVAITAPTRDRPVSGPITVTATASDDHLVSRVEFSVGTTWIGTAYTEPYSLDWNSGLVPNGIYQFKATAFDGAGNSSESDPVSVEVKDEENPIVTITEPENLAHVPSTPIPVRITASDNGVVRRVDLWWRTVDGNKVPVEYGTPEFFSSVMANPAESDPTRLQTLVAEFDWSAGPGTYELFALGYDGTGNPGVSDSVEVTIGDVNPPTCSIKSPPYPKEIVGTLTLEAEAVDDTQVARVDFFQGTTLIGTATSPAWTVEWEAGLVANGLYLLHCVAFDTSGGETPAPYKELELTVHDTHAPIVFFQLPELVGDRTPIDGKRITIEVGAQDDGEVASVEFKLRYPNGDELPLATQPLTEPPWSIEWDSGSVLTGDYDLVAVATDHAPLSTTVTRPIHVADVLSPVVTIVTPIDGATVTGDVTVKGQVTDAGGRVVLVEFLDGGVVQESFTADTDEVPFEFHWSATVGSHDLAVRATDLGGNLTELPVTVVVESANAVYDSVRKTPWCEVVGPRCQSALLLDGVGPAGGEADPGEPNQPNTIHGSCPDGTRGVYHSDESIDFISVESATTGADLRAGTLVNVTVRAWIYDRYTDRVALFYAADANAPVWVPLATLTPNGEGAQPFTATYTLPNGGLQALRASVRFESGDASACAAGEYNDHDDLVFAVTPAPDYVAPTVSLTSPETGAAVSGAVTLTAEASDDGGVASVEFLVDGIVRWTDYVAPYEWTWETAGLAPAAHTLEARATDVAGISATSPSVTVNVVDGVRPAVTITAPFDHEAVGGVVTLAATASDDVGVARVEFWVDAKPVATVTSAPYTATWNTAGEAEGPHDIEARAYDSRNETISAVVTAVVANSGFAAFDNKLSTPACGTPRIQCYTAGLVTGRGPIGPESDAPNTLGGACLDGAQGTFHVDESVDAIMVRSPTGTLTAGGQAIVEVKVWATQAFAMDALDLFAMDDAAVGSDGWVHVATLAPTGPGPQVLWTTYTLGAGTRQALRAQLRYAGAPPVESGTQTFLCGEATFDDRDDLVFEVLP